VANKRAYHHGDLRRALLDAALALAEDGGPMAVTVREAARRAGVSHNAPYRHFPDKETLIAALSEEGFVELARTLRTARAEVRDPEDRFVATGMAYLRFARGHPGHMAVMFGPGVAKSQTPELQRAANDAFQVVKDVAADAGIVELAETRRLGTVAWSFLHGLSVLWAQKQVPPSVGSSAELLVELGSRHLYRSFAQSARKRS